MHPQRLLADIGGTNIRLAWQSAPGGPLHDTRVLPCAQFSTVDAALSAYRQDVGVPTPREAALGIANPVTGDAIRMTNHSWSFSQRALREAFGFERLVIINDFTALALSLPLLTPDLLRQVGGMVPRLGDWFDRSSFRPRFEGKGRFQPYLASIPCWVIDPSATPALYGASRALDMVGADA